MIRIIPHPFSLLQVLNEISRPILRLAFQNSMPSTGFELLETDAVRNVEVHVLNALNERKASLTKEWNRESNIARKLTEDVNAARREITKAKAKVATKVNHVNEPKSTLNLVILGLRSSSEDYNTFDHPFHKFQFTISQRTRVQFRP